MRQVADEYPAVASGARLGGSVVSTTTPSRSRRPLLRQVLSPDCRDHRLQVIDLGRIFNAEIQLSQAAQAEMNFYNKGIS
jgi:hypothetical protein